MKREGKGMGNSADAPELLRAEGLCRVFPWGDQTVAAVKDVSLCVRPGTLTVVRGRSGSGKTTLLNLLGAIDRPTRGQVFFEGEEITSLPDARRDGIRRSRMGFAFQSGGLMSYLTAYENVEFALRIAGVPAAQRRERAEECLGLVGLAGRMNHLPAEMSGGEQQRVAIARAFSHRPAVLFADEPTSELDSAMGLRLLRVFRGLIEREKLTVVMTSHDPAIADVADELITLKDGERVDG